MGEYNIQIEVLDYWVHDNYQLGKGIMFYMLAKVGDKLILMETSTNVE